MTIKDLNDLAKLIKLCRKTGVNAIKIDNIELALGVEPYKAPRQAQIEDPLANAKVPQPNILDPIEAAKQAAAKAKKALQDKIEMPDELTEEQLMFYSSKSEPGQDNPQ